jgi:Helix-turn-helix domain
VSLMEPSVASDLKLPPQAKTVLRHLKVHGHITPMKALVVYGLCNQSLARTIYELRHIAGYEIKTERKWDDAGHGYAVYTLAVN